jgi:hypothetical protein
VPAPSVLAGPDWGTVPDWLAAVGTLAAFAVAFRLLAKELTARREYEEDRRRQQASRVASWVGVVEDPDLALSPWASETGTRRVAAVLHNGSEEPVYDCRVHLEIDPAAEGSFSKVVDGAFQKGERRLTLDDRTLPPGRIHVPLSLGRADIPHVSTWMTFTDASGRRWTRHPKGQLEGSPPEAPPSVKHRLDAFTKGQVDELDS